MWAINIFLCGLSQWDTTLHWAHPYPIWSLPISLADEELEFHCYIRSIWLIFKGGGGGGGGHEFQLDTGLCNSHVSLKMWSPTREFSSTKPFLVLALLTLSMRGPSFIGLTSSMSWLLIPRLLASPRHQQPWYWICKIITTWSNTRKDFNYRWHVNVEESLKM